MFWCHLMIYSQFLFLLQHCWTVTSLDNANCDCADIGLMKVTVHHLTQQVREINEDLKKKDKQLKELQGKDRVLKFLQENLVGHWKMDEDIVGNVYDESGNELHGKTTRASSVAGKFSKALHFSPTKLDNTEGRIDIPYNPMFEFGTGSFSITGWVKIEDYTYPMTNFAVLQGYGCSIAPGSSKTTPGWSIGHVYQQDRTKFCIRDHLGNIADKQLIHDDKFAHSKLLRKWTHYSLVFNRSTGKVLLYINSERQSDSADISNVSGSITNKNSLTIGYLFGWKIKGSIDEYRLYNAALHDNHVSMIYKHNNLN